MSDQGGTAGRGTTFAQYAAGGFGAAGVAAVVVGFASDGFGQVWPMALLAWATQLVAFGLLVAVLGRKRFMLGWGAGILFRFLVLGGGLAWVAVAEPDRPALRLLSLAGILFLLVLLEPVFLRKRR